MLVPADEAAAIERRAAAAGISVEEMGARLFAQGALLALRDLLAPLLPENDGPEPKSGAICDLAPTITPTAIVAASATEPEPCGGVG